MNPKEVSPSARDRVVRRELWQGGQMVALVEADQASADREIMHYAMMYSEDGPVEIRGGIPVHIRALARSQRRRGKA